MCEGVVHIAQYGVEPGEQDLGLDGRRSTGKWVDRSGDRGDRGEQFIVGFEHRTVGLWRGVIEGQSGRIALSALEEQSQFGALVRGC